MDLGGTVVGWNPGAERLFGYTQAEALGRRMEDLVATPEAREEVRANIRQTLGGEWIRDDRAARPEGRHAWWTSRSRPCPWSSTAPRWA